MAVFNYILLATALLAPTFVSAQNRTQAALVAPAFARCQTSVRDSQCSTFNSVDDCIVKAQSNFWDLFDAHAYNSRPIKDTPLGTALQNSRVKACICDRNTLKNIETCVRCVRQEAKIPNEEKIEVYDLGLIAQEACAITLEVFSGKSENKDWTSTRAPPTSTTTTRSATTAAALNTTTTTAANASATAFVNSTTTTSTTLLPTTTSPSGVESATPTPSKDSGAGVLRHVIPGAILGAMVAAMMAML